MTAKRMAGTIAAAFVVDQVLQAVLHGFVLAKDYAPYGALLRGQNTRLADAVPARRAPVVHGRVRGSTAV
jgi:hypothetical protein